MVTNRFLKPDYDVLDNLMKRHNFVTTINALLNTTHFVFKLSQGMFIFLQFKDMHSFIPNGSQWSNIILTLAEKPAFSRLLCYGAPLTTVLCDSALMPVSGMHF